MSRSIEAHVRALRELLRAHRPDDAARALPLSRAGGRVLARDVVAPLDLPPETNSQMDGFAVRAVDLEPALTHGAVELPVAATRAAGSVPSRHEPGTATAVMTGAALPAGADTVVPVERVLPARFDTPAVTVAAETARAHPAGTFVREAGSDVARGAVALPAGTVLGPAAVGACAALGLPPEHEVTVHRGPRVLVVSGGDEVLPAGEPLRPGTVHDANAPLLHEWLVGAGAERVTHLRVDDDPRAFVRGLGAAVERDRPELVLTSGGISAGAFEVVRQGLGAAGTATWFGHVAMQPGGPQGCGTVQGVPVVCLPGNPVSTWVSCEVLVRPALAAVWGCCAPPRRLTAVLVRTATPLADRTQLRRGALAGQDTAAPRVVLVGGASSHLLTAAAGADVLVVIPPGERPLAAGTPVTVLPVAGGVLTPRAGEAPG
ncbi:gephyrin-like molybdotransferase Glp [Kocuria sp.]|uniref:molybdopterin molybdotransferase MoeA n=1 Tax=Kocuria sp. TaxID=1871328 RepID=UPI0026DB1C83|nr:gephyrin-like molybdotransferase Glp [Kocuria sp.]MDO4918667.1 molybdopterin molybdotransferase MoeA [Kocuria sp.]